MASQRPPQTPPLKPTTAKSTNGVKGQDKTKASRASKEKIKNGNDTDTTNESALVRASEGAAHDAISVAPGNGIKKRGRPLGSKNKPKGPLSCPEAEPSSKKTKSSPTNEPKTVQQNKCKTCGGVKTLPDSDNTSSTHHHWQSEIRGPKGCTYHEAHPSSFGNLFGVHHEPLNPLLGSARARLEAQAALPRPKYASYKEDPLGFFGLPRPPGDDVDSSQDDPSRTSGSGEEQAAHRDNVGRLLFRDEEDIARYKGDQWPAYPPKEDEAGEESSFFGDAFAAVTGNEQYEEPTDFPADDPLGILTHEPPGERGELPLGDFSAEDPLGILTHEPPGERGEQPLGEPTSGSMRDMAPNNPGAVKNREVTNDEPIRDWGKGPSQTGALTVSQFRELCQEKAVGNADNAGPGTNPSVAAALEDIERTHAIFEKNPGVPAEVLFPTRQAASAPPAALMMSSSTSTPQQHTSPKPLKPRGDKLKESSRPESTELASGPVAPVDVGGETGQEHPHGHIVGIDSVDPEFERACDGY